MSFKLIIYCPKCNQIWPLVHPTKKKLTTKPTNRVNLNFKLHEAKKKRIIWYAIFYFLFIIFSSNVSKFKKTLMNEQEEIEVEL